MISKETKKHTKHTALTKPAGGKFHRNEWGIIGAPCDIIDQLAQDINQLLSNDLKIGYINADHKKARKKNQFHSSYTNKISFQNFSTSTAPQEKQARKYFNDLDVLLVNGNHFIADKQIVLINEDKRESLSKKTVRLTNIKMILLERSSDEIYDFVINRVNEQVKVFRVSETAKIAKAIFDDLHENKAPLFGLVLAGGKSQRMGEDKGALDYHGKAQREFEADLIKPHCHQVYISCRKNQDEFIETNYKKLYDSFEGLGPYGGILSAFREQPNAAWLTLACDLPYLNAETLKELVSQRNINKLATCFYNPETKFPEPLITIWEPRAYPVLLEFLSQGYSCPRKVLINTDIEEIEMKDPLHMVNINDKAEFDAIIPHFKS